MNHYKYLIIGGGITADSAAKGIRQMDKSGTIGLLSSETFPPYNRPPLSKKLWLGDAEESIWRPTTDYDVEVHLNCTATSINVAAKIVEATKGNVFTYDKLLIATGGILNTLPYKVQGINYFRYLSDYYNLRKQTESGDNFTVIGGGFIGSEIAAALTMNHKKVTLIFPEKYIGERIYPVDLGMFLNSYFKEKGAEVMNKDGITSIENAGSGYIVKTKSGKSIVSDGIIAGVGIKPDTSLAASAGIKISNGIEVNENLATSQPDIYAAGDVAEFYSPLLDKRQRLEHEDNANNMGETAGKNMAGAGIPYHYQPFFYSDLFDLGYEAVGELNPSFETVSQWKIPFREGVVYYLKEGRVRGVLLWNTWGQVDNARELIADKKTYNTNSVLNKLPA